MNEAVDAAPPATAGEMLRAARERQGVHLAVLAASLKVAQRKLELIEGNRYDELPDATFTRALALSMCRALKIDAEPVLTRLPQPQGHGLDQVSLGLNAPFRDRAAAGDGAEWPRVLSLPVIAALLLAGAAALVYVVPSGSWSIDRLLSMFDGGTAAGPNPASASATRANVEAVPAPVVVPAPVQNAVQTPAPVTATVALAADLPLAAGAASAVVDTVFSAPASAPPAGGMLTLRASAESWVEVRDRNGQILLSRTLAPGEAAGVDGVAPLSLTVGNAEATEVVFRGRPLPLAANRDNVARMELK
ncbi:helix-turn-helix domain-containing protein [uncultured Methylibium sp.]|uniref:helix-turn-helix domain-containing protein n=1 Tax=uncultured Methylibium sp. TaxID=381093 RepID=UPI0025FF59D2|nr:helix-turn-helix domain-containing protein [uncultured Methylibium sp.]